MTTAILAIDLGNFNSVSVNYDPVTKATEFRSFKTTPNSSARVPSAGAST